VRSYARTLHTHVAEGQNEEELTQKREAIQLLPGFARAVTHHLRGEKGTPYADIQTYLPKGYLAAVQSSGLPPLNMPLELTYLMTSYVDLFVSQKRIEGSYVGSVNASINGLTECLSNLERISSTPIPLAYQIHLKQLVTLYCLSLAPQLVDTLGFYSVFVTAFAAFAFFGVEFIGQEIENPFGYDYNDLPLEAYCQEMEREIQTLSGISYDPLKWKEQAQKALPNVKSGSKKNK